MSLPSLNWIEFDYCTGPLNVAGTGVCYCCVTGFFGSTQVRGESNLTCQSVGSWMKLDRHPGSISLTRILMAAGELPSSSLVSDALLKGAE